MAKGEIVKHLGDGRYQVNLKYAVQAIQAELAKINERIAKLAVDVPAQKSLVLSKESEISGIRSSIDAAIEDYRSGVAGAAETLRMLQAVLTKKSAELARLRYQLEFLIAENLSLLKRRGQVERIPEQESLVAWCADYTTTLTGTVGIADINDEGGQGVVIKPGFSDGAAYSSSEDGALAPRAAQSGAQVYFNAAVLPGVQKWFPQYRLGTISNIENDKCQVDLLPAQSSAQNLPINKDSRLNDVPIQYMECNGDAFEDGDTVVVRFTKSGPLVIGFYTEPRACELGTFVFMPTQYYNGNLRVFGQPEIEGDPLGTPVGENPVWYLKPSGDEWIITKYQPINYGCQDWQGPDGLVLTWRAAPGRCYRSWTIHLSVGDFYARSTEVYCRGQVVADTALINAGALVYGAGVAGNTLTVIARDNASWYAFAFPWDADLKNTSGPGQIAHTWPVDTDYSTASGFYFNRSGTEAIITLNKTQEAVATQKYIVSVGIQAAQVIWERGYEAVGSRSDTLLSGEEGTALAKYRQVYSIDQVQHQIPIYVDYVGDSEVTLYFRHSPYEYVADLNEETKEYLTKETQKSVDFVLSSGEILASIGMYKNNSFFLSNYEVSGTNAMTKEQVDNARVVTGDNVFFDVRSRVVMLEIADSKFNSYYSGVVQSQVVPGSVSGMTKTSFEMYVDGSLVIKLDVQETSYAYSDTAAYTQTPDVVGGFLGDILGPKGPSLLNDQRLVNVGFYKSGKKQIASLFVHYPSISSATGETETAVENQITGYSDVDLQLFGGRENMMLYGIGRR